MKKKALRKDFYMEIKKSLNRFFSIFLIVALGVAFFSGVRATQPDMQMSADAFYDQSMLMDIRVLSELGMTEGDLEAISQIRGVKHVMPSFSQDVLCDTDSSQLVVKLMSVPDKLNLISIREGRLPEQSGECLADHEFIASTGYQIGDSFTVKSGTEDATEDILNQNTYTIVGIGSTSYYLSFERGSSPIGSGDVDSFLILVPEDFNQEVYSELYISVQGADALLSYSDEYDDLIEKVTDQIEAIADVRCEIRYQDVVTEANDKIADGEAEIADGERKVADAEQELQDADRIGAIGEVFPLIFFLVAALVSLTTMTRMVEEERTQIGTLKALGYSNLSIAAKYLVYALSASLFGSLFGLVVGQKVLPPTIISAYAILYDNLPVVVAPLNLKYSVTSTVAAVLCTTLATLLACYKELLASPAVLMRPVAPKAGKRVLLERVTIIWKHLNFTQKSTIRNLIRYRKRFFMTVFGIGGCMALLLVGFGLKDSINAIGQLQFGVVRFYDAEITIEEDATDVEKEELYRTLLSDSRVEEQMYGKQLAVDIRANNTTKSGYLVIPENKETISDFITLRDRVTHEPYSMDDEGVVITEKLATLLKVKKGDTITLKEDETSDIQVAVSEITENYYMHYIYMSQSLYEKLYHQPIAYNQIFMNNVKNDEVTETAMGTDYMEMDSVAGIKFYRGMAERIHDMLKSMDTIIWVLVVSAAMLAFVVLYNLNNINVNERKRELATLKVLGFYDGEVSSYVNRENVILTVLGAAVGLLLGLIMHHFVIITAEIDLMMFGRDINPISYVYSIFLTFAFSIIVNFVMFFKLRRIDMIESLKSVE